MKLQIDTEREDDGRWIAEVLELPGVMVYAEDQASAVAAAQKLAMRVLSDQATAGLSADATLLSHPQFVVVQSDGREDVALIRAVQEGENSGSTTREEVLRALERGP
ncbi:MAG: type toxin-antitoxin system HicB family antitoxin [Gemmatimonadetes bacterium]|nr:type toxin-antitoxin system HicB family antitoxin [Gemmatimonadota bacterium]